MVRTFSCAAFLLFSQHIVVAAEGGVELNYDLVNMAKVAEVKFSSDGDRILEVLGTGTYREWNWRTGQIVRYGSLPEVDGQQVNYIHDSGYLFESKLLYYYAGFDIPYVVIWDGDSGETVTSFVSKEKTYPTYQIPSFVDFIVNNIRKTGVNIIDSESGSILDSINLTYSGKAKIYNDEKIGKFKGFKLEPPIDSFEVSADGSKFVLNYNARAGGQYVNGAPDTFIGFGDMQTGKVRGILDFPLNKFQSAGMTAPKISTDGRWVVLRTPDDAPADPHDTSWTIWVYDTTKNEILAKFAGQKGFNGPDLFFSDDGSTLASAGYDEWTVIFWDLVKGKKIAELPKFTNYLSGGDFSPDGRRFVTGDWDGSAQIWDVESGKLLVTLYAIPESTYTPSSVGLALLPDGRFAADGVSESVLTLDGKPIPPDKLQALSVGPTLPADAIPE
jgi:WD40 repeat protein